MELSKKQTIAKSLITSLVQEFGKDRWFIQEELTGITLHTMTALVRKGYLERWYIFERPYYRTKESK